MGSGDTLPGHHLVHCATKWGDDAVRLHVSVDFRAASEAQVCQNLLGNSSLPVTGAIDRYDVQDRQKVAVD